MVKKKCGIYCLQHSYTPSPNCLHFSPVKSLLKLSFFQSPCHWFLIFILDYVFPFHFITITYFAIQPYISSSESKEKPHMPTPYPGIRSILAKSHSLLHSGQTLRVFNHRWIQSRWNTCPHVPKVILSPLSFVGDGLA